MDTKEEIVQLLNTPGIKSKGLKEKQIIEKLCAPGDIDLFNMGDSVDIKERQKEIIKLLRREAKDPDSNIRKNARGVYKYIKKIGIVDPGADTCDTNYIGKGGEYAVMSELLLRGYNATSMTVDEGIDIVASKDNIFNYIQVKTTRLDDKGVARVQIKRSSYNNNLSHQLWYVVVIRCGIGSFKYFVFKQSDIEQFKFNKVIPNSDDVLSIKIRYNNIDGKPYLYDGTHEQDVSFWVNKF